MERFAFYNAMLLATALDNRVHVCQLPTFDRPDDGSDNHVHTGPICKARNSTENTPPPQAAFHIAKRPARQATGQARPVALRACYC